MSYRQFTIPALLGSAALGLLLWPTGKDELPKDVPEPVPVTESSSHSIQMNGDWGTQYQRTRVEGIADLRRLARTEELEDLFLFFPDRNIWFDVGYSPYLIQEGDCKSCVKTRRDLWERAIIGVYGEIPKDRMVEAIHYHPTIRPDSDHPLLPAGPFPLEDGRVLEAKINFYEGTIVYSDLTTGREVPREDVERIGMFETDFDIFYRNPIMAPSTGDLIHSWRNRDLTESCTIVSEYGDLRWSFPLDSEEPDYDYIFNQLSFLGLFTDQDHIKGLALGELAPFFQIDYLE